MRGGIACLALVCSTLAIAQPLENACGQGQSEPVFSEIGTSEEEAAAFLASLQGALASGDRRRVASMVQFPIAAWAGSRDETFKNAAQLLASYDRVFTERLKKTIGEARVQCLFTNSQGAMIHDGEVWFRPVEGRGLMIIKINGPIGPAK
ncbi:MAG TPA: hypothetical protein VLT89_10640 [Usitatibacter sp.]|nr:hypothetical protein [Usitatibacter sp.]